MKNQIKLNMASLRLFKAVPIKNKLRGSDYKANQCALEQTIPHGFLLMPEVIAHYTSTEIRQLIAMVKTEYGLSGEQMNNSFHKSWRKVATASIKQLVIEQVVHYITTYGFEQMGCYSKNTVFIPQERLDIPDLDVNGLPIIVIKGLMIEELRAKLLKFLSSGIALKEETRKDVVDLATYLKITAPIVEKIKNKEVRVALYDYLDIIPKSPIEFLRYIVYKATNSTLLINNQKTFKTIRARDNTDIIRKFELYEVKYGLFSLASIFLRFKAILFLAFRTNTQLKSYTNELRRLAKKAHKPMKPDYLNSVTAKIRRDERIIGEELSKELTKVNTFRKIRLAYALKFREGNPESIMYRIRNSKGYAEEFKPVDQIKVKYALEVVLRSIIDDLIPKVSGKVIYIPKELVYALPATEKQFTGNIPNGSHVTVPDNMVFGIHWEDVNEHRIDLDLKMMSLTQTLGWDAMYRNRGKNILFSGDLTAAPKPKGAAEMYHIATNEPSAYLFTNNYYNHEEKVPVPFTMFIARSRNFRPQKNRDSSFNYMVDPNEMVFKAKSVIKSDDPQQVLGLVVTDRLGTTFYFSGVDIGKNRTSRMNKYMKHVYNYMLSFYINSISLNDLLVKAGAIIVSDLESDIIDMNLSPEALEKDTLINLLS